jgi:hypothetical protein
MSVRSACAVTVLLAAVACTPPSPRIQAPTNAVASNPLGPSYTLLPLPSDDDALLGRILPAPPEPGHTLEETARANPCAQFLSEPKTSPQASTFDDAEELALGGKARASLGTFGFSGDADRATHFIYRLKTDRRIARTDSPEYTSCCAQNDCGYGYVSALVYGEGSYSSGEQASASLGGNIPGVVDVEGHGRIKVLHSRNVKGWLAAVVTITRPGTADAMGPLGVAKAAGISEASLPEQVKALYERAKISVRGGSSTYRFVDGTGEDMSERSFVRRYRDLTGSHELDEFDYRHDTTRLWVSGGLTGASLLAMLVGAFTLTRSCTQEDASGDENPRVLFLRPEGTGCTKTDPTTGAVTFDPAGTTGNQLGAGLVVFGGFAAIGFGAWFVYELLSGDSTTSHALTDGDAMLFAERYNRALLRQTITNVERSRQSGRTHGTGLRLGLTAQGLRATF